MNLISRLYWCRLFKNIEILQNYWHNDHRIYVLKKKKKTYFKENLQLNINWININLGVKKIIPK